MYYVLLSKLIYYKELMNVRQYYRKEIDIFIAEKQKCNVFYSFTFFKTDNENDYTYHPYL